MDELAAVALHEPWPSKPREREAIVFALWTFLASEVLLFGGLFFGYAVYRTLDNAAFVAAISHTNVIYGTANTAILMTSSLSIAVAGRALETRLPRLAEIGLWITLALGLAFLVVKGFEYREDLIERLWPGPGFALADPVARIALSFYWIMTAIHACHVTVGLLLIGRLLVMSRRKHLLQSGDSVEATSLYWHLVDVIWVVLYPLLYLAGR